MIFQLLWIELFYKSIVVSIFFKKLFMSEIAREDILFNT